MKYCLTCQTEGHFDDENIFWCENKKCRDYNMGVTERTEEIRAIVDFAKQHFVDRKAQAIYISKQHLEKAEQSLAFQLLDNKENPIESYITKMSNNHIPWPDIRQFHQVKKDVGWKAQYTGKEDEEGTPIMDRAANMPLLEFEGTVKVHGCFHADTPITLANGDTELIKNITVGTSVLSYDEVERKFVPKCVTYTLNQKINKPWVKLHFNNEKTLICTADHKIFTINRGWVEAQNLKSTDLFLDDKDEFDP